MLKRVTIFCANLFILFVLYSFIHSSPAYTKSKDEQENHPPVVKIVAPKNNNVFEWNKPIQYKIKVADPEDGESAFQEIPSDEVFLKVKYLADTTKASAELSDAVKPDPAGLGAIRRSNCLNCHAFADKLIGPSFSDISKRYTLSKSNIDILTKRIREGSTGVWGNVTMPTHSEISKEETEEIVEWILKYSAEPGTSYYRGTEGYFTIEPHAKSAPAGVVVVTASYTDHGLKDKPKQNLRGHDVIILQGK